MENATITARDLLYKILDYGHVWSAPERSDSKPAQVRISQIEFLAEAFALSKKSVSPLTMIKRIVAGKEAEISRLDYLKEYTDYQYLYTGQFIRDKPIALYKELHDKVLAFTLEHYAGLPEKYLKRFDLQWMFQHLISFRQDIYNVTYPAAGMLEGFSTALAYGWELQGALKSVIKDNLSEIDDTLWTILDPEKRILDKALINYVEEDLDSIDLDWRMENY